ncbi:replication initiator protein A [Deinococcus radiotolerans]|uniref:Replication initiator protein A n=1 Tax=Deinococcus radiotolerans TaxID=1309407 RepID=A0ABQ2FPC3_9DEIO|nr:replication initiator protein A [Deinococcus radiotolerans]GGL13602.1 hypothetical protein GCM10010844_35610 [Deinococcus radiotolerans]
MPPRKKVSREPVMIDNGSGYDELNLGRLSLISGQKTVPASLRTWQKNIVTPDGRPVIITCSTIDQQVVPHGLDNDFMVGLLNLCFEAGLPDGPFTLSAYGLLKAAGFPDTAQYYRSLEESLVRLNKAQYTIDEGWYAQGTQRWTTQSFAQVSYLAYHRSTAGIRDTSVITVQLAPPIMDSLRSGYIKPLDLKFYRTLSQPLVRAVYRQLDTLQFDDAAPNGLVKELQFPLMGWASRLGIVSDRPDNVERTLRPAHEELLANNYVRQVEITGRGKDKLIRYVFGPPPESEHPALVQLLVDRGVKQGVAVRLTLVFPDRIEEAARRFDHYVMTTQRPIHNRGGLLVSMVQRPEDFANLPGYTSSTSKPSAPVSKGDVGHPGKRHGKVEEDIEVFEAQVQAHVEGLTGPELYEWVYRQLSVLGVMKRLSPHERGLLEAALRDGRVDGRQVVREMTRRLHAGGLAIEDAIADLRLLIAPQ